MTRWQPVTPRIEPHVRPLTSDGIDFEVPPAEHARAARWLDELRRSRQLKERELLAREVERALELIP